MISILDIDPDLGAGIPPQDWAAARRATLASAIRLKRGRWRASAFTDGTLLVGRGLLVRELRLGERVAAELVGPGDVVDPAPPDELVPVSVAWRAVTDTVVARVTTATLQAAPPIVAHNVLRAATRRASRLGTAQAIAQLPRVDDRVLALFGHLAERWGQVTAEGVRVPLGLTHETIGQLIGAARPTVSLALKGLAVEEALVPSRPGWLLSIDALERLRPAQATRPTERRRRGAAYAEGTGSPSIEVSGA